MKGISASMCKGLKQYYWRRKRRDYQRLNGSGRRRRNRVELGTTRTRRRWRFKMFPKIRIPRIPSPRKLLLWVRDAYVRMMMGLANSRVMSIGASASGYGDATFIAMGGGFGWAPPKDYDEKMIVQIYKSLMIAQEQLVPRDASRIASEIACRR